MVGAKDEVMAGGLVRGRRRQLEASYRPTAASTVSGVVQRRPRLLLVVDKGVAVGLRRGDRD